tara:strand:+ start:2361 stop:5300 length:2940 start_codon:yes stop_codon:yes gene_type:complete
MAEKVIAIKVDLQGTDAQKKKLAALETEVKKLTLRRTQLNKAQKNGTITLDRYGREIAKVNTGLKAHRRQLLVTRQEMLGIDGFTTRLGKSFRKMGTSIVAGFAGMFAIQKIGQLFSNATKIFKDFEQGNANLASVLGTTSDKIGALTEDAKRLGAATSFSASEVTKLQTEFAKLGFTENQILDATEATLSLAAATGSDLAEAAAIAGATLGGFGLDASETQKVVDIMAKSFSTSALDIEKFRESMKFAAPAAKAVGVSVEETTALLGTLSNAGISGSLAGTGLAKTFTMLNKAGLTLQEGLEQVNNSQNKLKTATELVGQTAAKSFLILAEGTKTTKALKTGLENAGGAAKRMADTQLDTLEGKTKILNSAWEGLILGLTSGDSAFSSIAKGIVEATTSLLGFLTPTEKTSEALEEERTNLFLLEAELKNANTSEARRLEIITDLQKQYPSFLGNVNAETVSNEQLTKALRQVNDELINRIIIEQKQEDIDEQNIEIADAKTKALVAEAEALEKGADLRKKYNDLGLEVTPEGLTSLEQLKHTIDELNRVREEQNKLRLEDSDLFKLQTGDLNKLSKEINALNNRYVALSNSEKNYNKEVDAGNKLINDKQDLLDKFGITTEENTKGIIENKDGLNEQANAVNKVKFALEDLQEIEDEDDDFFLDEESINKSTNALERMSESLQKVTDQSLEEKDKEATTDAENLVSDATAGLDSESQKELDKIALKKALAKESIDLAQQTANQLIDVTSDRFEREKNLELQALDDKIQQGLISQEEGEKQREAIERKAFNKQKKLQLAQIAISLATEIASIAANSAGNPLNAFTFGSAGAAQNIALAAIATARSAIQAGIVASQKFADGGFTGSGYGSADSSGFKPAGIVHEGEYVVPKNVLESQRGASLVGALEAMRTNKPQPFSNFGFANGGFTSANSFDMVELENKISNAVANSVGSIQVVNNATDTITQAAKVNNIQSEATFG